MKEKQRPERNTVEHVPDEYVPPGPVAIAVQTNKNGRLPGHLYDVDSGVYMGPASDDQRAKAKADPKYIVNIRHIKCRVEL